MTTSGTLDAIDALAAAMHSAVVIFWTGAPEAPAPHTDAWQAQRREVFASALDGR